ncbi:MAG TPA: DUF4397 domain-containing protein [Hanamia sp.]|nr:DUF4397 domain-containing protein [Hanamia sp.]
MKKLITVPAIVICSLFSCKKESGNILDTPVIDSSHISITNISPSISNLKFYLNDKRVSLPDSPVIYGKTVFATYIRNQTTYFPDTVSLPYINISPGYQKLAFGSFDNNNIVAILNNNFEVKNNYSLFLTDTIIHGKVTSVLLKDNLLPNDTSKSQIRFINLSPDSPPMDIWAYPDAGYTGYKLFSDCGYLPNDFNSFMNSESFTYVDPGPYYFEATVANTSNVLLGGYLFISPGTIITIYSKGYLSGIGMSRLDVGVIQYEP